jgi:hypothetical protein
MNFDVRCECGGCVRVSEGAAGARIQCDCGRTVVVPSLDELRKLAGLPPPEPNPVLVIEDMLARGELPTVPTCAHCGGATSDTVIVTAECEKVASCGPNLIMWLFAWWVLGVFALLLRETHVAEYGRNLYLHLPVRLCRPCQRRLTSRRLAVGLGLIAVAAGLMGVAAVAAGVVWGLAMMVGSIVPLWLAITAMNRRRAALRNVLARERIYRRLLRKYPDARLLFAGPEKRA